MNTPSALGPTQELDAIMAQQRRLLSVVGYALLLLLVATAAAVGAGW